MSIGLIAVHVLTLLAFDRVLADDDHIEETICKNGYTTELRGPMPGRNQPLPTSNTGVPLSITTGLKTAQFLSFCFSRVSKHWLIFVSV